MKGARLWVAFAVSLLVSCTRHSQSEEPGAVQFAKIALSPDASALLGNATRLASAAGAGAPIEVAVGAGAPGDRISGVLTVPDTQCILLLARGVESVDDIDLFAYGEDGAILGADESSEKNAGILVCPPHPKHLYVIGRIAAGQGLAAISAQLVEPANAQRVGNATKARGRPGEAATTPEQWPGLEEQLAAHRQKIGGTWRNVRRAAVPLDPRVPTRISADIEAGECLDALVVPSEEVSHLEVTALDVDGRVIGRASGLGEDRGIVVCSPIRAPVTLELRPHAGRGLGAVMISRSADAHATDIYPDVARYDLAPTAPLATARTALAARLEKLGYDNGRLLTQGEAHVGIRVSANVDLPAGCTRLDVVAGAPALGVEARLWSASGDLLAEGEGGAIATLFACSQAQRGRLDVEAIAKSGPYGVEMRSQRNQSALTTHSLAASRLLSRMDMAGLLTNLKEIGAPEVVTLSPTHLTTRHASIPIGRCMAFVLGAPEEASGVELRLTDASKGEEITLMHGTYSATAEACAVGIPRTLEVVVEMRVAAGTGDGLVVTRLTAPKP